MRQIFSRNNLLALTDNVHDKWFNLDELRRNCVADNISFGLFRRDPFNEQPVSFITISPVQDIRIVDTEGIGAYDINRIVFNENKCALSVRTNIPLELDFILKHPDFKIEMCADLKSGRD